MEIAGQLEPLVKDRVHQIGADRNQCHLHKDNADELPSTLEMKDATIRSIPGNESCRGIAIDEFDYLGEGIVTGVYRSEPWKISSRSSNA